MNLDIQGYFKRNAHLRYNISIRMQEALYNDQKIKLNRQLDSIGIRNSSLTPNGNKSFYYKGLKYLGEYYLGNPPPGPTPKLAGILEEEMAEWVESNYKILTTEVNLTKNYIATALTFPESYSELQGVFPEALHHLLPHKKHIKLGGETDTSREDLLAAFVMKHKDSIQLMRKRMTANMIEFT